MTTYSFNITGLTINNKQFDPCATCDLLQSANLIEGFLIDENCEPVITFLDNTNPYGWGYSLWADFVKTFPMSETLAYLLYASVSNAESLETIENLLMAA